MSIGPYLSEFNRAYLGSRDLARREGQADLQEAMTMEELRQRGELGQDIGALTGAFQARRAALANQPPPAPGAPPETPMPEQLAGPPPEGPAPGLAAPPAMAPTAGGPAGAPAGEAARRRSLLESIDPATAGRLLRSGAGRSALKDLETAEKEQEQADNRRLAETVFTDATKAMRDGDALGYYDNAAKAMRIMGQHEAAAKYLEHAMNLRGDQEESKKANEDLGRWLKAQTAYSSDPSPDNYNKFMEELGSANSKASRALRVQIANNVLAKTFDQNPKVAGFSRGLAGAYRDAWAAGKDPDVEQIFKDLAGKDPNGFNAYIYDAMVGQKKLPDVVVRKVLKWDSPDKEIPKTISEKAWLRTRQRFPQLRADDPKFLEAWWADEVKMTREMDKAKAEKPGEPRKEVRADRSELRKRLSDVRAELRRVDPEDSARLMELRTEEAQAKSDLDEAEKEYRKISGIPEGKPQEVKIPVNPPSPKLKPTEEKYRTTARAEMQRLGKAGYSREQAVAEMRKAGWQ